MTFICAAQPAPKPRLNIWINPGLQANCDFPKISFPQFKCHGKLWLQQTMVCHETESEGKKKGGKLLSKNGREGTQRASSAHSCSDKPWLYVMYTLCQ